MKIKICGLTRRTDVEASVKRGATHIGFVLAKESPRSVDPSRIPELVEGADRAVSPVLVWRDLEPQAALDVVEQTGVMTVQVHRFQESDVRFLEQKGVTVHRAYDATELTELPAGAPDAPITLDVGNGGSGRRFDWNRLGTEAPRYAFIAGGITPINLPRLLVHKPYGIDVSSGIESEPGIKDPNKLDQLFDVLQQIKS